MPTISNSDQKRSRSEYKRGPKRAKDSDNPDKKEVLTVPFGGFGLRESEMHMQQVAATSSIEHGDPTQYSLSRAIVVASRRWRRLANERVKHLGQNMARLEILYLVGFSGLELNQGQLAQLVSVRGPTLIHLLNALAEEGLLERHQSAKDRRVTVNQITPLGLDKLKSMMAELVVLRSEVYNSIPKRDVQITLRTMDRILNRLDELG